MIKPDKAWQIVATIVFFLVVFGPKIEKFTVTNDRAIDIGNKVMTESRVKEVDEIEKELTEMESFLPWIFIGLVVFGVFNYASGKSTEEGGGSSKGGSAPKPPAEPRE